MKPRERVLSAIQLEEPDRVPVGELLLNDNIISETLGYNISRLSKLVIKESEFIEKLPGWKRWYGLPMVIGDPVRTPCFNVLMIKAAAKLGLDFIPTGFAPGEIVDIVSPTTFIDHNGIKWQLRIEKDWVLPWYRDGVLRTHEYLEKLKRVNPNDPRFVGTLEWMLRETRECDIYLTGCSGPGIWEGAMNGMGHTYCFKALYTDRPFLEKVLDARMKLIIEWVKVQLDMGFEVIFYTDDQAYKSGTFLPPKLFREMVYPRIKQMTDMVHRRGCLVGIHSCGNVWPVMDWLTDLFDLIHPLEPPVMDLAEVKERCGDKICLMGNVDKHHLLPHGTPEEVAEATRDCIRKAAPGGGYICSSSHSLDTAVKYENAIAYIRTVKKYGRYPIRVK